MRPSSIILEIVICLRAELAQFSRHNLLAKFVGVRENGRATCFGLPPSHLSPLFMRRRRQFLYCCKLAAAYLAGTPVHAL